MVESLCQKIQAHGALSLLGFDKHAAPAGSSA